jgi:vacuolar-type H+-ATPase subunit I/STV1
MKTQHFSTKAVGIMFLMALLYSQQTLASVQNSFAAESHSDNVAIVMCVLLFIIGFSVLIALKMHDDKKHPTKKGAH